MQAFCEITKLTAGGYDLVAKAKEALDAELTVVEELALLEESDLGADKMAMKRIKQRNFKREVMEREGFPRIDFTTVPFTSWPEMLQDSTITNGAALDAEAAASKLSEVAENPTAASVLLAEDGGRNKLFDALRGAELSGNQTLRALAALKAHASS